MTERSEQAQRADTGPGNFMERQIHRKSSHFIFLSPMRIPQEYKKCEWKLNRLWSQNYRVQALMFQLKTKNQGKMGLLRDSHPGPSETKTPNGQKGQIIEL